MPQHAEIRRTRTLLVWLYVVITAVIIVAGYLSFRSYQQSLQAESGSQLKAIASLKAAEVASWREEQVGDAVELVSNPIFGEYVRRQLESDDDATRALQEWLTSIKESEGYEQALLIDAEGAVHVSAPQSETDLPLALTSRIASAINSDELVAVDFYRDDVTKRIFLATIAPFETEAASGVTAGALVLLTDPTAFLYPYIQEWPGDAKTAETLLVRREGEDVLFLNELKYQKGTALELRIPLTETQTPAVQVALGKEVVMDGSDYRGVSTLAATKLVPDSDWGVVARVDSDEVYAPLKARLGTTIAMVVGVLVTGLLGILYVLRLQATRIYREQYELEAERSWLAAAIDGSLNEVYAFDAETLLITYANHGALENTGYTMDELALMTPSDIKPEYTADSFHAALEPLLSGEKAVLVFETEHLRKDGSQYPVAIRLQLTERGGKRLFLAMVNDITERRATEAELADYREHLELLVTDRTEQLQETNEELAATNEELAATNEELTATNEELESSNEELRTLYQEAAEAASELERLNSELELAGNAKSDFLASMSHELRTPLNSVIGFSDIMLQGLAGELNEEQARQMGMINSSGKHLLSLINDVLDLSKVEAGRMEPEPERFDLSFAVHEALDVVRPQVDERGLALLADGIDEPCEIVSDSRMVRQILLNLLSNAIKFTETGTVSVTVAESDSTVAIAVGDTGPGIAPADLQRIFDAFTQARVRDRRPDGTGLGLAVSAKLAALLGGELAVESAPGEGSTFTFTFPKAWTPESGS